MKNGYKFFWTDNALKELRQTIEYLELHWTEKELKNLATHLEKTLNLISQNPLLFQVSDFKKEVRRVVVLSLNTLYFRVNGNTVEIVSFFSNRQNPQKRKLK